MYDSLEEASEEEEDMLDSAFGLTPTSRLACQLKLSPVLSSTVLTLPKATRNFYVVSPGLIPFHSTHFLSDC